MRLQTFLFLFIILSHTVFCQQQYQEDSLKIVHLNAYADKIRPTNPTKTVNTAKEALRLAQKINFELGMAEAYRIMGTGYASLVQEDLALSKFLLALSLFKKHHFLYGEAMVYNNIGNRYKSYDHDKAMNFYYKCLSIAKREKFDELYAGCSINLANILTRNKKYTLALTYLNRSYKFFQNRKDSTSISMILLSKGFLLVRLREFEEAEKVLKECKKICLDKRNYLMLGSINLNLSEIYTTQKKFAEAESIIKEGFAITDKVGDNKLEIDFLKEYYYLEYARKNFKEAIKHLQAVYSKDSISFNQLMSRKITLHREQYDFIEKQKQTEILLEKQKTNRVIYIATVIVLILSLAVIALLVINSRKRSKTLKKMRELNEEISIQKENLDEINRTLEETVRERTADLSVKNLKLSQYSSHLSHEIRSPISTIKGLLLLDDEDLIDDQELIQEVRRCVDDIDNKLLNINHMLHNPQYKAFVLSELKNGAAPSSPGPVEPSNPKDESE